MTKRFGSRVAVDGLRLDVPRGACSALLGPNGAGKSTTMALLVGLLEPDSGAIELGRWGSPITREAKSHIGWVPQHIALYPELTAVENLSLFGSLYGVAGRRLRLRVEKALAVAGLEDRAKEPAASFSGGMKRRLNIACALVHEPELIVFDEPTVGVDAASRERIFECVEWLRREGKTIVYSTHDLQEAERLCDRVAIIDSGRLVVEGPLGELIASHGGHPSMLVDFDDGSSLVVDTDRPEEVLVAMRSARGRLRSLRVRTPTLVSVYEKLGQRPLLEPCESH